MKSIATLVPASCRVPGRLQDTTGIRVIGEERIEGNTALAKPTGYRRWTPASLRGCRFGPGQATPASPCGWLAS